MLSIDDLKTLTNGEGFPKISIYLPIHPSSSDRSKDSLQLKNSLRAAEEKLVEGGCRPNQVEDLLGEARGLVEDRGFWEEGDAGVVLFIDENDMRTFRLPLSFEPRTVVADRFHVRPLVPLFMRDGRFAVLIVAQDHASLMMADRHGMAPVRVRDMPVSVDEFLAPKVISNAVDYHSGSGRTTSRGPAPMFVSQGESPQEAKLAEVERYANQVGKAAAHHLAGTGTPLVLAADDKMLGMVRSHMNYPDLIEGGIRQNPRALSVEKLHEKAYELVRERLDADRRAVMERVDARLANGEPAAGDVADVIEAAHDGRVEALLISPKAEVRGQFTSNSGARFSVSLSEEGRDLVELAIAETLAHGGSVYSLPADSTENVPMRAVLRY